MRQLDQLAALFFSEDPRQKLDKIVAYLVAESEAQGGALFAVHGDKLVPQVIRGIDLERLAGVQALWEQARSALAKGRAERSSDLVLAPASSAEGLVGVLCLDTPRRFDDEESEMLRRLLARGLAEPHGAPTVEEFLSTTSTADTVREQLLVTLERNEWNVARVARLLGVTRRTIYMRLQRYGIKRKKVPKTIKGPALA